MQLIKGSSWVGGAKGLLPLHHSQETTADLARGSCLTPGKRQEINLAQASPLHLSCECEKTYSSYKSLRLGKTSRVSLPPTSQQDDKQGSRNLYLSSYNCSSKFFSLGRS